MGKAAENIKSELLALAQSKYGKAAVRSYMQKLLEARETYPSEELELPDDSAYIMILSAVVNSGDQDAFYTVDVKEGEAVQKGAYEIPGFSFRRKEGG